MIALPSGAEDLREDREVRGREDDRGHGRRGELRAPAHDHGVGESGYRRYAAILAPPND